MEPRFAPWKCPSGRTHTASISGIGEALEAGRRDGLAIAVKRTTAGIAIALGMPVRGITRPWLAKARADGATEIHEFGPDAGPDVEADLRGAS